MLHVKPCFRIQLDTTNASQARDSLARMLYDQLFQQIVRTLNTVMNQSETDLDSYVGILDIAGFGKCEFK